MRLGDSVHILPSDCSFCSNVEMLKSKSARKNALSEFKFKEEPHLKTFHKHRGLLKFPWKRSPASLTELAAKVVVELKLPVAHFWLHSSVLEWLEKIGFPQYKETFSKNFIIGRTLIHLDASALVAMNIRKQADIIKIAREIRELFGMENIKFSRSISLPPRLPFTHFQCYRANTGPTYQNANIIELFRKMKLICPPTPQEIHWTILEDWLKHKPSQSCERIGGNSRGNLYKIKRQPPAEKPAIKKKFHNFVKRKRKIVAKTTDCRWNIQPAISRLLRVK